MRALPLSLVWMLAAPAAAGTVTGTVEVLGKGGKPYRSLDEVVVYLDGVNVQPQPTTATVDMKGKQFRPRLAVVPVGGTVVFPNRDPILHNVFSVSDGNAFDLDLYKRPEEGRETFRSPGVVRIYCNIHPQMSGIIMVRDNPFFATAERSGTFRIDGVPPGRYTLKAWHERAAEEASVQVVVPEHGTVSAALSLDASKYRRSRHRNKFGKSYEREKYE